MGKLRFGLWYDFRNPPQWRQDPTRLYEAIIAQVAQAEALGWDAVWLSEHHFIDDGYAPSMTRQHALVRRQRSVKAGVEEPRAATSRYLPPRLDLSCCTLSRP